MNQNNLQTVWEYIKIKPFNFQSHARQVALSVSTYTYIPLQMICSNSPLSNTYSPSHSCKAGNSFCGGSIAVLVEGTGSSCLMV